MSQEQLLIGAVVANAGPRKLGGLEVPCSRSAAVASQMQTVQTLSAGTKRALTARRVRDDVGV
jgi:hypothetical protein